MSFWRSSHTKKALRTARQLTNVCAVRRVAVCMVAAVKPLLDLSGGNCAHRALAEILLKARQPPRNIIEVPGRKLGALPRSELIIDHLADQRALLGRKVVQVEGGSIREGLAVLL